MLGDQDWLELINDLRAWRDSEIYEVDKDQ